jgi:toxin ParE1/3/4
VRVIFTPLAERQIDGLHDYITVSSGEGRGRRLHIPHRCFLYGTRDVSAARTATEDLLPGLRTIGFERRITIAFVVAPEAA